MAKPIFHYHIPQYIYDPEDRYNFQVNDEWLEMRKDRFTASLAKHLISNGKGFMGLGAEILKTINSRAMQKSTGWIDDECVSKQEKECVLRGLIYERDALEWYSEITGRKVVPCGFIERGSLIGCSPDGVVVDERLVQVKIPMPYNFPTEVQERGKDHLAQCEMELLCADYPVNDLVIYSPERRDGFIREVPRNVETDRRVLLKALVGNRYRKSTQCMLNRLDKGDYYLKEDDDASASSS